MNDQSADRFRRIHLSKRLPLDLFLGVAGIALLGGNLTLLRQNHVLQAASLGKSDAAITEGKHLQRGLSAATMDGELKAIAFSPGGPQHTLLITFSPVCPHCKANHDKWLAIAEQLRHRGGWRIVWVSRDPVGPTKDYCEDSNIPAAEAFADPPYRAYVALDLKEVPNTVVLDEKGVVQKVWRGELDGPAWRRVFEYLKVPLPLIPAS